LFQETIVANHKTDWLPAMAMHGQCDPDHTIEIGAGRSPDTATHVLVV
jgi:hypothetical protein